MLAFQGIFVRMNINFHTLLIRFSHNSVTGPKGPVILLRFRDGLFRDQLQKYMMPKLIPLMNKAGQQKSI